MFPCVPSWVGLRGLLFVARVGSRFYDLLEFVFFGGVCLQFWRLGLGFAQARSTGVSHCSWQPFVLQCWCLNVVLMPFDVAGNVLSRITADIDVDL